MKAVFFTFHILNLVAEKLIDQEYEAQEQTSKKRSRTIEDFDQQTTEFFRPKASSCQFPKQSRENEKKRKVIASKDDNKKTQRSLFSYFGK